MEMNFASRGVGNAALTTGIIGTALSVMNGGLFGNLFGGGGCCSDNMAVNRYELAQTRDLVNKDMEIAYLRGRDAAKSDTIALYNALDTRFRAIEGQISAQAVINSQLTANISCVQTAIATLNGLTKTVIPISNVCPAPMPEYNSWTAPTATT